MGAACLSEWIGAALPWHEGHDFLFLRLEEDVSYDISFNFEVIAGDTVSSNEWLDVEDVEDVGTRRATKSEVCENSKFALRSAIIVASLSELRLLVVVLV